MEIKISYALSRVTSASNIYEIASSLFSSAKDGSERLGVPLLARLSVAIIKADERLNRVTVSVFNTLLATPSQSLCNE